MEEPGKLQSMGSQGAGHELVTKEEQEHCYYALVLWHIISILLEYIILIL